MTIEKIVVRSLIIPPVLSIAACSPMSTKKKLANFKMV